MMTKILAISILFLYLGLFKDTEQCSNRHVLSRMPRDRYYSLLCQMLIMSMISTYPRKIPSISFYTFDDITYFHTRSILHPQRMRYRSFISINQMRQNRSPQWQGLRASARLCSPDSLPLSPTRSRNCLH